MQSRYLLLLFFMVMGTVFGQYSSDKPMGWYLGLQDIVPLELSPLDLESIVAEDAVNDLDKTQPWRYGILRPIVLDLNSSGEWTSLQNGDRIWRVAIKSPEAINLGVNFSRFYLPQGSRLQMYNLERTDFSKVYTNIDNRTANVLGSWFITGEVIVIEYFQPKGTVAPALLKIGNVIHGYRMGRVNDLVDGQDRGLEDSGDCNLDVNCSVGSDFESKKNKLKKAVALLNLGNGHLCSAALVNNALQDKTPYLLTANHCLENSDPSLWSIRFNWVSPSPICGEVGESADLQTNFTMSGAEIKSHNAASDFALVELFNPIPSSWDVAFAGWDNSDDVPQFQVGIHHPSGDIMKICRDNDPAMQDIANGTYVWLIKGQSVGGGDGWDMGTTESGSSGSPLFNEEGSIIGQLYAGLSVCNGTESNGEYDIYGRFGISWNQGASSATRLMDWLDPDNTGLSKIPTLENSLNIGEFEMEGQLAVFPNPATTYISVMNTQYPDLHYEFYNLLGQKILSGNMFSSENILNIEHYSEGIYFLHLIDGDTQNSITKKVVIRR
jgi:lysyl endopeptidase